MFTLTLAAADKSAGVSNGQASKCFGQATAPMIMEVFSDFQCPACRQLYLETLKQVIAECTSTGKVYLVHRDFPLAMHPYARTAARYANAAARINKFAVVENQLFQRQTDWANTGNVEGIIAQILTPAEMTKLKAQLSDPKI